MQKRWLCLHSAVLGPYMRGCTSQSCQLLGSGKGNQMLCRELHMGPRMAPWQKAELHCAGSPPEERPGQHQQGPGSDVHQLAAELLIQHAVVGQGLPQLHLHIAGGGTSQAEQPLLHSQHSSGDTLRCRLMGALWVWSQAPEGACGRQ